MKANEIKTVSEVDGVAVEKEEVIVDMQKDGWVNSDDEIEIFGDAENQEERANRMIAFLRRYQSVLQDETIAEIEGAEALSIKQRNTKV